MGSNSKMQNKKLLSFANTNSSALNIVTIAKEESALDCPPPVELTETPNTTMQKDCAEYSLPGKCFVRIFYFIGRCTYLEPENGVWVDGLSRRCHFLDFALAKKTDGQTR